MEGAWNVLVGRVAGQVAGGRLLSSPALGGRFLELCANDLRPVKGTTLQSDFGQHIMIKWSVAVLVCHRFGCRHFGVVPILGFRHFGCSTVILIVAILVVAILDLLPF